ncbi:DUF4426 domain-containing protein [Teredinibacter waterburyi]|jgi:hypothetical protein|uniref:DUF4426 domain-containing protein n=1 Tax=Teredinibacter waterburyi TaxID=1500538 RepID=UPI00165FB54F|nr:DUF4426 domain-containing protein [Teredinibacter waterburyi]
MSLLITTHRLALGCVFAICTVFAIANSAHAESNIQGSASFENFDLHYSLFPSTFLLPEVAAVYKIKRSEYETLINVSISHSGKYGGVEADISGTVTNLMQQQKRLEFIEIKEESTVYYIAPIRISGEELVHFNISAKVRSNGDILSTTFSQKLYQSK